MNAEPDSEDVLWLWKNGDHMLAYRHLYPCYPGGDPMVLGEPVAKAYLRQSFDRGGTSPQAAQTDEREAFEAWLKSEYLQTTREPDSWGRMRYTQSIECMWKGYQAGRAGRKG